MELKDIKLTPLLDTLRLEKISDKVYFSEKYSNYVSNSRLGLLNPRQDGNPDKFFSGLKFTTSQALALGSAVHELVLQPDSFELSEDVGKPTAKLGVMADELYPIFVERDVTKDDVVKASDKVDYYKGKITKDRANDVISECSNYWTKRKERELDITQDREIIYLDNKSLEIVKSCVSALNSNKQVQNFLFRRMSRLYCWT